MTGRAKGDRPSERRGPFSGDNDKGCWLWTGGVVRNANRALGYGKANVDGATVRVHRAAFEATTGSSVPEVRHTCDETLCYRPCHLVGGTSQDNADDMVARQRQSRGIDRHNAFLPFDAVEAIRAERFALMERLAIMFGVTADDVLSVVPLRPHRAPLNKRQVRVVREEHAHLVDALAKRYGTARVTIIAYLARRSRKAA